MPRIAPSPSRAPSLWGLLKPYKYYSIGLVLLTLVANSLTLWLPYLLSQGIESFLQKEAVEPVLWTFALVAFVIFLFTYGQSILQTYFSERVARDLRAKLSDKVSTYSFAEVEQVTPAKLLTNLTSDIDSIKTFFAQGVASLVSSVFLILGGSILLLSIDWKLGLLVLTILPLIGGTFFVIFGKVRVLFVKTREVVDWLNKVINESILGAALIRVLHAQKWEQEKFSKANQQARDVGVGILKLFAAMIPLVTFFTNFAVLLILVFGGKFVIEGSMSLGDFAAFNSYLIILVFPIFILGFMSNIIAQAQASYGRVYAVLSSAPPQEEGTILDPLDGSITLTDVGLSVGEKVILKNISLSIPKGSKVAIIGPTAAGKTQLLQLLIGLTPPTTGEIRYGEYALSAYHKAELYKQLGLVFQESAIFHLSLRENIAFNTAVSSDAVEKALKTAELSDFIASLPDGLDTLVSERGTSLSGGQKQRVMLARALAIDPKILLLDDFTARVDTATEQKILANLEQNYPGLTLVSVTQKIGAITHYDHIIVLMEGEVIGVGTHQSLMETCPEYVQIYTSQQSTNTYELQS